MIVSVLKVVDLINGNIKFTITIPNPFKSITEAYKAKKEYTKALDKVYRKMALAESEEALDLLIKKKEVLEDVLKINKLK